MTFTQLNRLSRGKERTFTSIKDEYQVRKHLTSTWLVSMGGTVESTEKVRVRHCAWSLYRKLSRDSPVL